MALGDDREAVALDAVDEPQLPERLRAVEALREDPRRQVPQILLAAGARQRGVAEVVLDVELRVVDPLRPALAVGDEAQLLAEPGDEVQPRGDVVAELVVFGRRALEQGGRGDVHVGRALLEVQERGIEAREAVVGHALMFPTRAMCA